MDKNQSFNFWIMNIHCKLNFKVNGFFFSITSQFLCNGALDSCHDLSKLNLCRTLVSNRGNSHSLYLLIMNLYLSDVCLTFDPCPINLDQTSEFVVHLHPTEVSKYSIITCVYLL